MPVYNKRGILLLPKVIVLNPKDGVGGIREALKKLYEMIDEKQGF